MKKIVFDIYGADAGPNVVLEGVANALKHHSVFPVLVGDETIIHPAMAQYGVEKTAYQVVHTTDVISHNEPATCIFGGRDQSSIALAYKVLKEDEDCIGMISAGNTGALLVGSICRLGLLPSIKFPALGSALPCNPNWLTVLVDCGSTIDCTPKDLLRFAKMGDVFSRCYCNIEHPRVGILSVGREDGKGSTLTLEAYKLIKETSMNFIGNLEGSDLVSGYAHVVVSDGFSGNVLLKSTEAAGKKAMEIVENLKIEDTALKQKIKTALWERFDFNSRGAATFLGTKKIVTKMHGCANVNTTLATIEQVLKLHHADFSKELTKALS